MAKNSSRVGDRTIIRRRRSLATVLAGVTLGAGLTIASGFTGLVPGLVPGTVGSETTDAGAGFSDVVVDPHAPSTAATAPKATADTSHRRRRRGAHDRSVMPPILVVDVARLH